MQDDYFDQDELQADIDMVGRLERAQSIKNQQRAIQHQNQIANEALTEALTEAGINQAQWQKMLAENPELATETFKSQVKRFCLKCREGPEGKRHLHNLAHHSRPHLAHRPHRIRKDEDAGELGTSSRRRGTRTRSTL